MKKRSYLHIILKIYFTLLFVILVFHNKTFAEPPQINWIAGPTVVDLGSDIAEIDIPEEYMFANSEDSVKLMEFFGNRPSKKEVGTIFPTDDTKGWFILFEYSPSGYVKDDEKDSIDADALLKSMKRATEKGNKWRSEKGFPPLHLIGWQEEPYYDLKTNNLTWATLVESEGQKSANFNTRLLGRQGHMAITLVSDPNTLNSLKPELESILANFYYKKGKKYAEYLQGDKVAKYGLTALIAGGAGAAAIKYGLLGMLAKSWKIVAVAVVGFFSIIWGVIKSFFGRKDNT